MEGKYTGSDIPLARILEPVRRTWGFERLRPLQEQAIRAELEPRDSVVVLPTGGGKSLCYQVPPLVARRTDIVVSPLISLMKDQVDGLRACGYPAAAIHSGMSQPERDETVRGILAGKYRLVFVSPERILMPSFLRIAERVGVRAFAIDEAHCISHWGHDFRPEYRRLAALKERFPHASVHAYTATAAERVLRIGHDPPALFASVIWGKTLPKYLAERDFDTGLERLRMHDYGPAEMRTCELRELGIAVSPLAPGSANRHLDN